MTLLKEITLSSNQSFRYNELNKKVSELGVFLINRLSHTMLFIEVDTIVNQTIDNSYDLDGTANSSSYVI